MRKKQQQEYVRTITTGYVEADMLGHCMIIAEEMSNKQNTPQRPHREGMKESKLSSISKWSQTAPTACWRSLEYILRKIGIPKCDNNCHKCSFGCSLRRIITNGK